MKRRPLFVTTDTLPRTSLSDMPLGFEVVYARATGWQLWFHAPDAEGNLLSTVLAEETPVKGHGLKLEVKSTTLCNSLKEPKAIAKRKRKTSAEA